MLVLHGGGGTRERRHNHYLKGLLWCGACGRRFVVMRGKGNGGTYFYYFCKGRQDHACDQKFIPVATLEAAVARHYATVRLSAEFCTRVRAGMEDILLTELGSLDALRKHLSVRLEELDARETTLVRLVGKPGWPEAKIQAELSDIEQQRTEIQSQLKDTSSKLDHGRQFFLAAMKLLQDPQAFYIQCGTSLKKAMNKVIFEKLFVEDGEITGHDDGDGQAGHRGGGQGQDLLPALWRSERNVRARGAADPPRPRREEHVVTGGELEPTGLRGRWSGRTGQAVRPPERHQPPRGWRGWAELVV